MKKFIITILLISCLPSWSQDDRLDSLLNDLLYNENEPLLSPEKPVNFNFLYSGINFNSNTFYAGREIGTDMYNLTGHVYYYSSKGLFLGASGNWYSQLIPGYSTSILSAGYYKSIDKKNTFTFRTSYSRFFYYQPDTAYDYPYNNNLSTGLSFRKKWIGGRVTGNLLFGQEFGMNISSGIYSRIHLLKFGKYNKIYTMPEVSVFFGSETVESESSALQGNQLGTSATTELQDVYSLLNTQLYLPLCLSVGDFDIELGYTVNFPTTKDINITYPVSSYYSVSVGYILPFFK